MQETVLFLDRGYKLTRSDEAFIEALKRHGILPVSAQVTVLHGCFEWMDRLYTWEDKPLFILAKPHLVHPAELVQTAWLKLARILAATFPTVPLIINLAPDILRELFPQIPLPNPIWVWHEAQLVLLQEEN